MAKREPNEAMSVPELLRQSAVVYEQRNVLYGDNYKKFGDVMKAIFPDGVTIMSTSYFNRFGILIQIISKLTRYCEMFDEGGHDDSLLDLSVYANMLRELDEQDRNITPTKSRSA